MRLVQLHPHLHPHPLPVLSQGTSSFSHQLPRVFEQTLAAAENTRPVSAHSYVVKSGDTLSGIAATLKTRAHAAASVPALVARLTQINHLDDPDTLAVGQRLALPPELALPAQAQKELPSSPPRTVSFVRTYGQAIAATARRLQVDPTLSLAVARAESGISAATDKEVVLNPRVVSQDGKSVGLFQLTSETGKAQLQQLALREAYNPLNPYQNIRLGVGHLKQLSAAFSTETPLQQHLRTTAGADAQEVRRLAVAAYNAGVGRVARAQAQALDRGGDPARYQDVAPYLPATTRRYVERVERFAAEL
ncbi:MAG: transglycosylase SLT domain-containing protein [Deltaproteobacteria bacterium]|nr:transglycosylase SLT domain-containing protein [Deltaproteobacteria bacterium]